MSNVDSEPVIDIKRAFRRHRREIHESRPLFQKISKIIGQKNDLGLHYYDQLFCTVLEYKPDVIVEVGRSYGNSTCIFTEAANRIGARVISICLSTAFTTHTLPKIHRFLPAGWSDALELHTGDICYVHFEKLIQKYRKVLFYWDAHGWDVSEYILGKVFPALAKKRNIVLLDDVFLSSAHPELRKYQKGRMWKGFHPDLPYVFAGDFCSNYEEFIAVEDFTRRNGIRMHSFEQALRKPSKTVWFTIPRKENSLTFPKYSTHKSQSPISLGASLWEHRSHLQKNARLLHRFSEPYRWTQLLALVKSFQPDIFLEVGVGQSTLPTGLDLGTELCFSRDPITSDYRKILQRKKRPIIYWNHAGMDQAEILFGKILPLISRLNHMVLFPGISDTRFESPGCWEYGERGLWRADLSSAGRLRIGMLDSASDLVIPLLDFTSRNSVSLFSGAEELHGYFRNHPGRFESLRKLLGADLVSDQAHLFWLSLDSKKRNYTFPRLQEKSYKERLLEKIVERGFQPMEKQDAGYEHDTRQ